MDLRRAPERRLLSTADDRTPEPTHERPRLRIRRAGLPPAPLHRVGRAAGPALHTLPVRRDAAPRSETPHSCDSLSAARLLLLNLHRRGPPGGRQGRRMHVGARRASSRQCSGGRFGQGHQRGMIGVPSSNGGRRPSERHPRTWDRGPPFCLGAAGGLLCSAVPPISAELLEGGAGRTAIPCRPTSRCGTPRTRSRAACYPLPSHQ